MATQTIKNIFFALAVINHFAKKLLIKLFNMVMFEF